MFNRKTNTSNERFFQISTSDGQIALRLNKQTNKRINEWKRIKGRETHTPSSPFFTWIFLHMDLIEGRPRTTPTATVKKMKDNQQLDFQRLYLIADREFTSRRKYDSTCFFSFKLANVCNIVIRSGILAHACNRTFSKQWQQIK